MEGEVLERCAHLGSIPPRADVIGPQQFFILASCLTGVLLLVFGPAKLSWRKQTSVAYELAATQPFDAPSPRFRDRVRSCEMPSWLLSSSVYAPLVALALLAAGSTVATPPLLAVSDVTQAVVDHYGVAVLILSLASLSISLDQSGFFRRCAAMMVAKARGDGVRLLLWTYGAVSVLTFFTSSDIVIMSFTPVVIHVGLASGITNLRPLLVTLFVAANTASAGLYVGNATNIVMGDAMGMTSLEYIVVLALPTAAATSAALLALLAIFVWFPCSADRQALTFQAHPHDDHDRDSASYFSNRPTPGPSPPRVLTSLPEGLEAGGQLRHRSLTETGPGFIAVDPSPPTTGVTAVAAAAAAAVAPTSLSRQNSAGLECVPMVTAAAAAAVAADSIPSSILVGKTLATGGSNGVSNGSSNGVKRPHRSVCVVVDSDDGASCGGGGGGGGDSINGAGRPGTPGTPASTGGGMCLAGTLMEHPYIMAGKVVFVLTSLILLICSDDLGVSMSTAAASAALFLLFMDVLFVQWGNAPPGPYLERVATLMPWEVAPFVLSMFIMVGVLTRDGLTRRLAELTLPRDGSGGSIGGAALSFNVLSSLLVNGLTNVPASVLWADTLPVLCHGLDAAAYRASTLALLLGSNIGAFATVAGTLAGLMWGRLMHAQPGVEALVLPTPLTLTKYGGLVLIPTVLSSSLAIWAVVSLEKVQ